MEIQKNRAMSMLSHSFPGGSALSFRAKPLPAVAKMRIGPAPGFPRLFRSYALDNIR
jgi:hypothetical protein